jgi:hypothetical protein
MDLWVDDAGQQIQASAVNEQLIIVWFKRASKSDGLDDAIANSQIANTRFVGQDHRCSVYQEITRHVHPL